MSKVLIAMDKGRNYRLYLTVTTDMVEQARLLHNTTPLATAGLGRVLTAAGLMGIMLKNQKDRLTIIFKGDGPAKQILATADGHGRVKGYIQNPQVDLPLTEQGKLDVGSSLGIGELTVIKDMGLKKPYTGSIALVSGEIAEDLTAYYFISEQQSTSIALGVKVDKDMHTLASGGMFIQMLPEADVSAEDALEEIVQNMQPISAVAEKCSEQGVGKTEEGILEDIKASVFAGINNEYLPETLEFQDIYWDCDCSMERMEKALVAIGKKALTEIIEEDGCAELECHFCGKKYNLDEEKLYNLLDITKQFKLGE